MTPRVGHRVILAALLVALGWQSWRVHARVEAGRLLHRVEIRTQAALARRKAPSTMFAEHLAWLDRAKRLAPAEVGVPMAIGAQHLLLRRPDAALAAYRAAALLEPRPEIDLNIGRALLMRGDTDAARAAFARAVRLSPHLAREVPPDARPTATP
ncbi:hypothetical protein [Luteitalea sp.]